MANLDFTVLDDLFYGSAKTKEERQHKDELIDHGYMIVDGAEDPFLSAEEKPAAQPLPSPPAKQAVEAKIKAGGRADDENMEDYPLSDQELKDRICEALDGIGKTSYFHKVTLEASRFYRRHYPPICDIAYWQANGIGAPPPLADDEYFKAIIMDISRTVTDNGGDPFLGNLLSQLLGKLSDQYKTIRQQAAKNGDSKAFSFGTDDQEDGAQRENSSQWQRACAGGGEEHRLDGHH